MPRQSFWVLAGVLLLILGLSQMALLHFWTATEDLRLELERTKHLLASPPSPPSPPLSPLDGVEPSQAGWMPTVSPSLLHTKMFSSALHPFTLKPFHHRSSLSLGSEALRVSLATIVTPERRDLLPGLAQRWNGHLSVTYRIRAGPTLSRDLRELESLLGSSPALAERADFHVVVDDLPMQFNLWRNIARLYSPAKSILTLDVDFLPDPGLHQFIVDHWELLSSKMTGEKVVFVIPAFEFPVGSSSPQSAPSTKDEVVELVDKGQLAMFHEAWYHGQGHTNYTRWLAKSGGEPLFYQVTTYHFKYEPYVLIPQEAPFCDERFIGYGSNKCACAYELKAAGYSFAVLRDGFLIHRPHPSDGRREGTGAREKENQLNLETMRRFMKDMEVKYGFPLPSSELTPATPTELEELG